MDLNDIIRRLIRPLGYELYRNSGIAAGSEYEQVIPRATYAPWNCDKDFINLIKKVERHTLVDKYRCWELWNLVSQSRKLEGALIEIGVWRGGTAAIIAHSAQSCGIQDRIFLCDTFKGVIKTGEADSYYHDGKHSDTSRKIVENLLSTDLGLSNYTILEGIFPDETAKQISAEKFRFCHIDVDIYESAQDILSWIWDKMVVGGIIVYDDYGFQSCPGIRKHIHEQQDMSDRLIFHNLNGHAIVVKIK